MSLSVAAYSFAASPDKVIRSVFEAADDGFDMVKTQNYYSGWVADAIFETLLNYDYLARPAKLVPNTAEAMPVINKDGKTYTFKLKKNIYFAPDPVFGNKKRELTAEDYVYSIKRLADPENRSAFGQFHPGENRRTGRTGPESQKDRKVRLRCARCRTAGDGPLYPSYQIECAGFQFPV